ncbi:MAG: TRAP transporter small permease subunit [Lachnospiraceae bacterium]|nr:TRAP transporter small permease subunit [Lachnospiraceae bacterium]
MVKVQEWVDKVATFISAVMCGAMIVILLANIILRFIPNIGGFSWYMESSQYLNVWSMLIVGMQITVRGTHLRVELIDTLVEKSPVAQKIVKIFNELMIILFYMLATYSGYQLSTKAKQAVSTMQQFTMGQVYSMIPIACGLCAVAAVIDLIVSLQKKTEGGNVEA